MATLTGSGKSRIAVFSGPTATSQNNEPVVTSNKARKKCGLPPRRSMARSSGATLSGRVVVKGGRGKFQAIRHAICWKTEATKAKLEEYQKIFDTH